MNWSRYFIGLNKQGNYLFIGTGDLKKNGEIRWTNKSGNRSEEIIHALATMFRIEANKNKDKPYFGYEIPRVGKLILIKPGHEFIVGKKKYKNNTT